MAKKSLSDLGELTSPKTEAPAAAEAAAPAADTEAPAETIATGADQGVSTQGPQIEAVLREQQLDKQGRAYATGRRKDAVARVWLKPGPGRIRVNDKEENLYFARPVLRMILRQPLVAAGRDGQFDVICKVVGGGLSGQAGAVRHGISKALIAYEPNLRPVLKQGGFLTRDPRVVERKKYGRPKARRSFQFSKR